MPVFTPDSVARPDEQRSDRVYHYTYADTTPWYDELSTPGTKLTGDVNPIGFKGISNSRRRATCTSTFA